jgi:hypothetical protein
LATETRVLYEQNADTFEVSVYRPEGLEAKSLILVPPTGGINLIDRSYARAFCENGYHVYLVHDWPRPGEDKIDLEVHQAFYSNAQKAIASVLASIQAPFVGILGTSVGALHASISMMTLDKIDAAFLIVGGLPIAEVVVTSDQKAMQELRAARQKRYEFKNDAENILGISKVFDLEPMSQGAWPKKKSIGIVISTGDKTVPYATQKKLQDFFQPQKVIALKNNHFWAIVKTWAFYKSELISFFEEAQKEKLSRSKLAAD